jgi:hypothetical protein
MGRQTLHRLVEVTLAGTADHNRRALPQQRVGNRQPDPTRAASDDRDLAL